MAHNLQVGQVKSIRSNGGKQLDFLELLFSENTIARFEVDRETNKIKFLLDNTELKYQDLSCDLSKSVIKDLYVNIRDLYNELTEESEEA